jgi:toxin ParE1/3/4
MPYVIVLTRDAEHDLEDHVLERLLRTTDALRSSPEARILRKRVALAWHFRISTGFVQTLHRLIYRVHATQVVVYVVADGRRDLSSLLARRLLGA